MKKQFMTMAAAAALLVLAGCGTAATTSTSTAASAADSAPVKADGTYTAQMDDASAEAAFGWRDQLVVEYKDGAVVSAVFESYDADGNKKSEISSDVYPMDPTPSEWIPQLSENIAKADSADAIEGISGATMASSNARAMMEAIEASSDPAEVLVVSESAEASESAE